jgi:hypothetical protein
MSMWTEFVCLTVGPSDGPCNYDYESWNSIDDRKFLSAE